MERISKTDYYKEIASAVNKRSTCLRRRYGCVIVKNDEIIEQHTSLNDAMKKFMDKLLKHAQMTDSAERAAVIDSFEFGPRDVEWITDAVDEAMYQYSECGKNMRMFRDKMLQLSVKKMVRSGKSAGKITYKKSVVDRAVALKKRKDK